MNKLQRVIDAANVVSPELGAALADLYAGKIHTRVARIWPDTSRTITLPDGREAQGLTIVMGREGYDVVEVAPEIEGIVFTERRGHALLGVSGIRYASSVNVVFQEVSFSDEGGRGIDVRLLEIS